MSLLAHHAQELYEGSGIDPGVVAARGYRSVSAREVAALGFAPSQCRPGLFLPTYSLAGVRLDGMLKPDEPRTDEHGKAIKYEWPADKPHLFDCHPDALTAVKAGGVAKWWTEGHKKADAGWSHGIACVNLSGVWTFLRGRLVVPDLDELDLDGETSYVVFDSDVTRKPAVAEALLRLCEALRRRGAKVFVVYLPEGPDGAKVGLDDFFVAGGTVEELEELAQPWDGAGPGVWLREGTESDVSELRRQLAAARADASALVAAIANPELTRSQLIAAVAVATETHAKQARGAVEANGKVVLSASEIADDWRPKPEPGKRLSPLNPTSGRRPRMARERVGALMTEAIAAGLVHARPLAVTRRHPNGSTYKATNWVVDPAPSVAAALKPWTTYGLGDPKARKPRSAEPCPDCGEFHPIMRQGICTSCGCVISQRVTAPKPPADDAHSNVSSASDKLSEARNQAENRANGGHNFQIGDVRDSTSAPYYIQSDDLSEATDFVASNGHAEGEAVGAMPALATWPVRAERRPWRPGRSPT